MGLIISLHSQMQQHICCHQPSLYWRGEPLLIGRWFRPHVTWLCRHNTKRDSQWLSSRSWLSL